MLAALNLGAVALGVAAGGFAWTIVGLLVSGGLVVLGVDGGADIGLVSGMIVGFATGGWVAGSRSRHSHRFHGMTTGLVLAFLITAISLLGGSQAGLANVLWLALLAIVVSGLTGWLAGRRRQA